MSERNYDSFKLENDTLCWACAKSACLGCSWIKSNIPVNGWDAEKTIIKNSVYVDKKNYPKLTPSYKVNACPEYEYDGRTRPTHKTRREHPELFRKEVEMWI